MRTFPLINVIFLKPRSEMLLTLVLVLIAMIMPATPARAQMYTGMSGLLHVPSAEMDSAGQARLGAAFINRNSTPAGFTYKGDRYHTGSFYLSITPFKWVEIGYTMVMLKVSSHEDGHAYFAKDRHFSVKFQPLAEKPGKWWPSVAVGSDDFISSDFHFDQGSIYWQNFYLALTKTLPWVRQQFGVTLAYRYFTKKQNRHWNGIVGGITYRPCFAPNFRAILEYAGGGQVDFGIDCVLWKHLMLQASLHRFKYFNAGICYTVNLF